MSHDIRLNRSWKGVHVKPQSAIGMLWLQTHFTNQDWIAIADGTALLSEPDATKLANDADYAGLKILFP